MVSQTHHLIWQAIGYSCAARHKWRRSATTLTEVNQIISPQFLYMRWIINSFRRMPSWSLYETTDKLATYNY